MTLVRPVSTSIEVQGEDNPIKLPIVIDHEFREMGANFLGAFARRFTDVRSNIQSIEGKGVHLNRPMCVAQSAKRRGARFGGDNKCIQKRWTVAFRDRLASAL